MKTCVAGISTVFDSRSYVRLYTPLILPSKTRKNEWTECAVRELNPGYWLGKPEPLRAANGVFDGLLRTSYGLQPSYSNTCRIKTRDI